MLEKFVTIAAHDLRSPLNTLHSYMEIIIMDGQNQLSKNSKLMLADMKKSTALLMEQVTTLVSLYKQEQEAKVKLCDINQIIAEVRFNLSDFIKQEGAKIITNDLPVIDVHPDLLRQLFQNLIENSLKYRSAKLLLITIKASYDYKGCLFEIEDNGSGITEAQDPFKFFEKGGIAPQRTGIGMSLCQHIVDSFGGEIWVDHAYNEGCRVCFFIPEQQNQKATAKINIIFISF